MAKRKQRGSNSERASYKLNNIVANLSKRCQVTREAVREFASPIVDRVVKKELTCPYCDVTLTLKLLSFDHKTPISREGPLWGDNVVYCCLSCNKAKGDLDLREWCCILNAMVDFPEKSKLSVIRRLKLGGSFFGRFTRRWRRRRGR